MPERRLPTKTIRRSLALAVLAAALAAPLAFMAHGSSRATHAARPVASAAAQPQRLDRLDRLRNEAALGGELASHDLVAALLNRYDERGQADDLYEALIWIDRQWDIGGPQDQAQRVVAQYCGQRIVRWHRLCQAGE